MCWLICQSELSHHTFHVQNIALPPLLPRLTVLPQLIHQRMNKISLSPMTATRAVAPASTAQATPTAANLTTA